MPLLLLLLPTQNHPLVIVHVESQWAGAARVAQEVTLLADSRKSIIMLTTDCGPAWAACSEVPEIQPSEVIAAPGGYWDGIDDPVVEFCGGYFRGCLANAVKATVRRNPDVTVILPMKAVYHGSKRTLYEYRMFNYKGDGDGFLRYVESVAGEFGFTSLRVEVDGERLILSGKKVKDVCSPLESHSNQEGHEGYVRHFWSGLDSGCHGKECVSGSSLHPEW
ncbi:MAG: hypothetical protein JRE40_11250 [Deltaproteobacteria bacterium]|nr:hypothetical protein [Deltaproteobacteria bacterium]